MNTALTSIGFIVPRDGQSGPDAGTVAAMMARSPSPALAVALEAAAKGYGCIPVRPGTKVPTIRWKQYQDSPPSFKELPGLFADTRANVALITTGLVIFDCDDPAMAERVIAESGDTPYRVRTPRGGVHLGYRARKGVPLTNRVDVKGLKVDIRTTGGLIMLPPSSTEQGDYAWLGQGLPAFEELPVARIGWTRERKRRHVAAVLIDDPSEAVTRARAYLRHVEGAVSGQYGHNRCFRAACILVQKFGLGFDQAWPLLHEWNRDKNLPPFSDRELEHKLRDALKKQGS